MEVWMIIAVVLVVIAFTAGFFIRGKYTSHDTQGSMAENGISRNMRELQVLEDIQNSIEEPQNDRAVVEAIAESIRHLIDCSVLSFVVRDGEGVFFSAHSKTHVSGDYISSIQAYAIRAFSAFGGVDLEHTPVSEHVEGAVVNESGASMVADYMNVPIVVHGSVIGVITCSNTEGVGMPGENVEVVYKIVGRAADMVGQFRHIISAEESKRDVVIESMPDAVIMIDRDFELITLNQAAKHITEFGKRAEFDIYDLMEAMSFDISLHKTFESVLKTRKQKTFEEVRLNNAYYDVAFSPIVEAGYDVEPLGVVVVLHDVTQQVEAEHQTREFTSMIVHELRSPLGVIRQSAELAREEGLTEEDRDQQFYMIEESAKSMLGLVNDLLDASKLEAGKIDIDLERVNIRSFIEDRMAFYKNQAAQKDIAFSFYASKSIPSGTRMDAEWMREAINNYLSNALKFTPSGG